MSVIDEVYKCKVCDFPLCYDCPKAELRWIPVTERLPKGKETVLITNDKGNVRCGQYRNIHGNKEDLWIWKHKTIEHVLAWMPLPDPYEVEE